MKTTIYSVLLALMLLSCSPSQKIISSWVNREALPKGPYKSIFVISLSNNDASNFVVEDEMANLLAARGLKTVRSTTVFPPKFVGTPDITREELAAAIKQAGCDAVITIALLDTKTVESYQPGTVYAPMGYGYYGSYYGYYNHYYPEVYSPGYYTTDKTYYIENNFYDMESDLLLWSIQSSAYNPSSLESWFDKYSIMLLNQLKKEGLITK